VLGGSVGIAALLGMVDDFAGVVQAPWPPSTSSWNDWQPRNIIVLMCASMPGYGTARMISSEPRHALSPMRDGAGCGSAAANPAL
jgi:H+/Cl- antiporter ClcA